jgi:uncharacterized protein YbjT (DUF2867 family)
MAKTFLVTGGTGRLGAAVVERLRRVGHTVRVVSRRAGPELFTVDWTTGAGLATALDGVDVVVHCASATDTFGLSIDVEPADVQMDDMLVKAAAAAHVSHLLYISIVGVDRIPIRYYRIKLAAEEIVARSGVPFTTLRATQFHELIRGLFVAAARGPIMLVPALSVQSIDVSEVADRFAELALAEPAGRVTDLGGAEILKLKDLAQTYLQATGQRRPIVPFWLPGKAFSAFRAGYHLAPDHADGRITFASYLAARPDDGSASDRGAATRTWTRAFVIALASMTATLGMWAGFAPESFFERGPLPFLDTGWVAKLPPYNEHLVRDYGFMNLGMTVVLAVAAIKPTPTLVRSASAGFLVFGAAHVVFHSVHLQHFSLGEAIAMMASNVSLTVLLPAAVFLMASRLEHAA